ncbi:MAG: tetratricopeptide repeat protein, partial [Acidobacteria bacterium]|nr:tetratricopeptide repeat protein [Acidobacteriota bacterium]
TACGQRLKLVALVWLFFLAQGRAQQPEQLLQQADAALQKQDYAAAAQALETYLAAHPDDHRAEFNLAYAYSLLGRRSEAILRYRSVLSREKDLAEAHLNLGILLLDDGNAAEAAEHLQVVVGQQPNNGKALFRLAQALATLHRNEEARSLYERFLSIQPDHAPAHLELGRLLAASDPAAAESHLRRALALEPSLESASLLLASLLETQAARNPEALGEAAAIYRRALDSAPQRNDVRLRLGQLYALQKRFSDAIKQWETVRDSGESTPELEDALLQAYLQVPSEKEKILPLVQEILARDPSNSDLWLLAGRLWTEKKDYREAAKNFLRVVQLQPEHPQGYTNLASVLFLMKDYSATVAALAKLAQWGQDTPGTYFLRAISLDQLRQRRPAVENYQRFLESDGEKNPDQEFQARQRIRILSKELQKGMK